MSERLEEGLDASSIYHPHRPHRSHRYDEGAVVLKVGREEPVASMDSSGKVIWARHNEVRSRSTSACNWI